MAAFTTTMSMDHQNMTLDEMFDALTSILITDLFGAPQEALEEKLEIQTQRLQFRKKIEIGIDTALSVLCLGSLLVTCWYCVGLIRKIFLWKSVLLALICIVKLIKLLDVGEFNTKTLLPRKICLALLEICNSYNQFFTVFLHFEMKNLLCKMEKQKKELSGFLIRAGIGLMLITVVITLEFGLATILEKVYLYSGAREVVYELKLLCHFLNIFFTILIISYGQQSLVALRKSSEFRQQSHVQNKAKDVNKFLVHVIKLSIVFQLIKVILQIINSSVDAFFKYEWMECTLGEKTTYRALYCLDDLAVYHEIKSYILRIYWPHLLELIAVNTLIMRKQGVLGH